MLDKNTINSLKQKWTKSIKIFFYDAWCSGTKVDIEESPNVKELVFIKDQDWIEIYTNKEEKDKFENSIITRVVIADHTWKEKLRYIFSSKEVKDRCGCGSSFSFSKKVPKINFDELKNLKSSFKKIG